jgi:hypothetical protein
MSLSLLLRHDGLALLPALCRPNDKAHRGPVLLAIRWSRLLGSLIFLFRCTQHIHGPMDDSQDVNLV